ncbi:MAG: sigma-70 family RNA polymerase sigma factor [Myxococcota bacterium]
MAGDVLRSAFEQHRRHLWGICYRMLGTTADADDVLQQTFLRALERPPPRLEDPLRPWLVKVAINLARDRLRQRKRRRYEGPWLPAPVEGDLEDTAEPADAQPLADARYDLRESATLGFLVAVEALSPRQRAVLILQDVLDYTVKETATALEMTESNVKVTLHRARKAMQGYDRQRVLPTPGHRERVGAALERFLMCLAAGDVAQAQAMLAHDVRAYSDGGGEVFAARKVVVGAGPVVRFLATLARKYGTDVRAELRTLNGLPAVVMALNPVVPRFPLRSVLQLDVDDEGRITRIYNVVAPSKLRRIRPV